jgi:hypothetical protein
VNSLETVADISDIDVGNSVLTHLRILQAEHLTRIQLPAFLHTNSIMMQNPLLGYSSFSHFLDFRHQQYPPPVRGPALGSAPSPPSLFMYSALRQQALTSRSSSSSSSGGGSPSPPSSATTMGKSFTIDAILGLRDANKLDCGAGKCMATDLTTGAKHPQAASVEAVLHHPLQPSYGIRRPSQGEFVRQIIPCFDRL